MEQRYENIPVEVLTIETNETVQACFWPSLVTALIGILSRMLRTKRNVQSSP
jgi:hypothetical protein